MVLKSDMQMLKSSEIVFFRTQVLPLLFTTPVQTCSFCQKTSLSGVVSVKLYKQFHRFSKMYLRLNVLWQHARRIKLCSDIRNSSVEIFFSDLTLLGKVGDSEGNFRLINCQVFLFCLLFSGHCFYQKSIYSYNRTYSLVSLLNN